MEEVTARRPERERLPVLLPALVAITLVAAVVASLGAPLLPSVARSYSVSLSAAQWSLTTALLAGAIGAPVLGRLGDGAHRREAVVGALTLVTVGGVISALAPILPILLVGRTLQGIGLGMAPVAMAVAHHQLPAADTLSAIGLLSVTTVAGAGAGYPVAGLIDSAFGLDAAFYFGAALSACALLCAIVFIPSGRGSESVPLDLRGAAVGAVGLVALLLAVGQGGEWGWDSVPVLALFLAAICLLAGWIRLQLRTSAPLIQLRWVLHRPVLAGDGAAFLLGIAMYMFVTVVTGFLQVPTETGYGFGASPVVAGLCLVPFSLLTLSGSRLMWRLKPRFGSRLVFVFGTAVTALAGAVFALGHTIVAASFVTMGVLGLGFGFTFAAIPSMIAGAVPRHEAGSAMGFYQVVRTVGFSIGSALVASVLTGHLVAATGFPSADGYAVAAWIGTFICVLAGCWAAFLTPPDPTPRPQENRHDQGIPTGERQTPLR